DASPVSKAKPAGKEVVRGNTIVFDSPDDDVNVEGTSDDNKLVLTGRVRALVLGRVNGIAVVDGSKLQARRAVVRDTIEASARVTLKAALVEFDKPIHGDADVVVEAPGGKVIFHGAI